MPTHFKTKKTVLRQLFKFLLLEGTEMREALTNVNRIRKSSSG